VSGFAPDSMPATVSPRRPRRRGGPKWLLPALMVGGLAITGFALLRPREPGAVPVNVIAARTATLTRTVNGTGTAQAEVSRTVSFAGAASGNVASVNVSVGDEVQAGQVLARLDTAPVQRDLDVARAALNGAGADLIRAQATAREGQLDLNRQANSAGAALEAARAALTDAERSLAVQRDLLVAGAVSQQEVRTAQLARDDAARKLGTAQNDLSYARSRGNQGGAAGISQARAALETARVRVQNLERTLEDAALRAPTGGVVSSVNVTTGNPAPGDQAAVEITDPARLYLEVPFDETRAADLRVGQPATIRFDALPSRDLGGAVDRVEPVARTSGQVASVLVRLRLQDVRGVKPGFTGSATVTTRRLRNAVTVPLETTTLEGGQTRVWRVTPGEAQGGRLTGTARPVTVTIRERNASTAAVQGVKAGDLIVTPSPGDLEAGVSVSYAPAETAAGAP
jgi:HlyD family secretion protein